MFGVVRARIAHKTGYGHKRDEVATQALAGDAEARVRCSVNDTGRVGVGGGPAVRRPGSPPAAEATTLQWLVRLGSSTCHAALQPAGNRRVRSLV